MVNEAMSDEVLLGKQVFYNADDYDGDGVKNYWEYAMNGNPIDPVDVGAGLSFEVEGNTIQLQHVERLNDGSLRYVVETSASLKEDSWTEDPEMSFSVDSSGFVFDRVTLSVPAGDDRLFVRLRVETVE